MGAGNTNVKCCGRGKLYMWPPCGVCFCFRQTPLTRLSIKRAWSLSHYITNLSHRAPFIYQTSFRPAPMARTSQARPCLWCWSQLAGGKPPGPPGMHASSQFSYSSLIPVLVHNSHLSSGVLLSSESSMLYLDLHLYHSTRFARLCLARGKPLVPPVHIFYSCSGTHV